MQGGMYSAGRTVFVYPGRILQMGLGWSSGGGAATLLSLRGKEVRRNYGRNVKMHPESSSLVRGFSLLWHNRADLSREADVVNWDRGHQ